MKRVWIFFLLLGVGRFVEAGTVRLVNDTATKLRAVIRAADGTNLGEVMINPLQTMSWNDYWGGVESYNQSRTPYTVVWYCAAGGDFSVCSQVATGSTVTAYTCDGARSCRPTKQQKKSEIDDENSSQDEQLQEPASGPPSGQVE